MPPVRLFVGNLPYQATEDDLRTHFAQVGAPTQIVRPLDRETGRARGFAFVEYAERAPAEVTAAKAYYNSVGYLALQSLGIVYMGYIMMGA